MMPLAMVGIGGTGTIRKVGGSDETRRFLGNLGFVAGTKVVILGEVGGGVIVGIRDSRVALNADMARHIMV